MDAVIVFVAVAVVIFVAIIAVAAGISIGKTLKKKRELIEAEHARMNGGKQE